MAGNMVTLSEETFTDEVLKSPIPVLIDLWAPWCAPCKLIAPIVEELSRELDGRMKVGKLNVDENPKIAVTYGVMSIPTLLLFKGGQVAERIIGYIPKKEIMKRLDKHINDK